MDSILFLFESSFKQMSSFVSLIPRDCFGGHCRNLSSYKDRSKCNSHFLRSGFLSPRPISSPNVLTDINCLLNCYFVKMSTDFLHLFIKVYSYNKKVLFLKYLSFIKLFLLLIIFKYF